MKTIVRIMAFTALASAATALVASSCSSPPAKGPIWDPPLTGCAPTDADLLPSVCVAHFGDLYAVSFNLGDSARCVRVLDPSARLGFSDTDDTPRRTALELDPAGGRSARVFTVSGAHADGTQDQLFSWMGENGAITIEAFTESCAQICAELDGNLTLAIGKAERLPDGGLSSPIHFVPNTGPRGFCKATGPKSINKEYESATGVIRDAARDGTTTTPDASTDSGVRADSGIHDASTAPRDSGTRPNEAGRD